MKNPEKEIDELAETKPLERPKPNADDATLLMRTLSAHEIEQILKRAKKPE